MNNLFKVREKIKRANRLYEIKLLATKNGEVTPYKRSVFEERIRKTKKEMKKKLNSYLALIKKRVVHPLSFSLKIY